MNSLKLKWNFTNWIFDFDGNILNTPTSLIFKKKKTGQIVEVLGYEVDKNPQKYYWENSKYEVINSTYKNFWDISYSENHKWFDQLFGDVNEAIEKDFFAPSFETFKNLYLIKARIFSILTARRNWADNFQRAFLSINDAVLNSKEKKEQQENIKMNFPFTKSFNEKERLDYYFWNMTTYVACSNPHIEKFLFLEWLSWSERKAKSMDFLVNNFINLLEKNYKKDINNILKQNESLSYGFSDDSIGNIVSVFLKFLDITMKDWINPKVKKEFSVFFTWKSDDYFKVSDKIEEKWAKKYSESKITENWLRIKVKI